MGVREAKRREFNALLDLGMGLSSSAGEIPQVMAWCMDAAAHGMAVAAHGTVACVLLHMAWVACVLLHMA